jgi:hypothetical protein
MVLHRNLQNWNVPVLCSQTASHERIFINLAQTSAKEV